MLVVLGLGGRMDGWWGAGGYWKNGKIFSGYFGDIDFQVGFNDLNGEAVDTSTPAFGARLSS